jgi:hypothetical protein
MDSEFSQEELDSLIKQALSAPVNPLYPKSGMHLGFAESDMLSLLETHLKNKLPESEINTIYQDLRTDILSRKINSSVKD